MEREEKKVVVPVATRTTVTVVPRRRRAAGVVATEVTDEGRMDKLSTLLLPPLREGRGPDGTDARVIWTFCVEEHPVHQTFSRGPWPEYYWRATFERRRDRD